MKKFRRGFTLIEVVLFLGLTAALFVGIAAGVGNSVYQQRYSDAVQNYAEFLRTVYSQVANVQSESTGRSGKAVYGKVVTFRAEDKANGRGNVVKTYNLIGDLEQVTIAGDVDTSAEGVSCVNTGGMIAKLGCLEANVLIEETDWHGSGTGRYKTVGFVTEYRPRWDSEIQTTDGYDGNYEPFEGIVIIARSPNTGNISTFVWAPKDNSQEMSVVRDIIDNIENCSSDGTAGVCKDQGDIFRTKTGVSYFDGYTTYLSTKYFQPMDLDFCLNPAGSQASSVRRDIRITKGAHNASAISILDDDKVTAESEVDYTKKDQNRCK